MKLLQGFALKPGLHHFKNPIYSVAGRPAKSLTINQGKRRGRIVCTLALQSTAKEVENTKKRCLRCNTFYVDAENGPQACSFHGHMNGDRGLLSLAPPHQGIDGEWTDASGVIVYKWNDKDNRPNTGRSKWKKRWSCCGEYDDEAPPCRRGWHVSYDDGGTLF